MTLELPANLRFLDEQLQKALGAFAPPADLDAKIVAHVSRRSRLRLVMPSPRVAKGAAAVMAASLLVAIGYVADRQMNGGQSSIFGDIGRLVAMDGRRSGEALSSADYLQDDIRYSSAGDVSKLSEQAANQRLDGDTAEFFDAEWQKDAESHSLFRRHAGQPGKDLHGSGNLGPMVDARYAVDSSGSAAPVNQPGEYRYGLAIDQQARGEGHGKKGLEMGGQGLSGSNTFTGGTRTINGVLTGDKEFNANIEGKEKFSSEREASVIVDQISTSGPSHFKPGESAEGSGSEGRRARTAIGAITDKNGKQSSASSVTSTSIKSDSSEDGDGQRPADAPAAEPAPKPNPAPEANPVAVVRQKVIRNGTVEFEVDSFDTSLMTITKLVIENGGFVASTDSAKLPNGKMRGAVTLRIPPERLDAFVLMLRGLGDLKSQKISAQDVSKQYTDVESQLRAARAMEERLLEMIKTGKGAIKDLLAAEKELGTWREKIETLEGEIRYYDNLIGMSTLTVILQERNIKASAASMEVETISAGVETDDVEKARAEIIKAIDEAKGRIITSELKKLDAGQFSAMIVAEVAPDRSGSVVDRLKQLGKVARLDIDRKQTTVDGSAPPVSGAPVEQKPTKLTISLYNLANVGPRLTTTATLASGDVEQAYQKIMTLVEAAGGRIVTSQLQRPQPDQVQATMQIEVPSAKASEAQGAMVALGEVMNLQLAENPDTANVTTAKQGFQVRIISAAGVAARETATIQLASKDVAKAHRMLADLAARLDARVIQSNVNEGDGENVNAVLQIDLPRAALAEWEKVFADAGDVMTRSIARSSDLQNTLDSKVRMSLTLFPADRLPPRQLTSAMIRTRQAESQQQIFLAKAKTLGGRIIDQTVSRDQNGRGSARVAFDVPRDQAGAILDDMRGAGEIWSMNTSTNAQAPEGPLSRTRFELQFSEGEALVGAENGFWSSIKAGLATSLKGLGYSLRLLIVAVCLVAPWAAVLWGSWKLLRRRPKGVPASAADGMSESAIG